MHSDSPELEDDFIHFGVAVSIHNMYRYPFFQVLFYSSASGMTFFSFYRFRVENFQEILGKILLEIFSVNLVFFIRNCLWVSFTHIYFRILYSVSDIKKIARNLFIVKKIYIYI